jgi:peptide/nickel transport system substrate-binding protein
MRAFQEEDLMFASSGRLSNVLARGATLLASLVVVACTSTNQPTGTPSAAGTPAAASAAVAASPTAVPRGGTLRIDIGALKVNALDPNYYNSGIEKLTTQLIAEPLINRDPTSGKLVPGLATSWTVGSDGLTWTIALRKGVNFTDGTPVNAQAVVANIERWKDPAIRNSTLKAAVAPIISQFSAVDDSTVRIVTDAPRPGLPAILSGWGIQIVSPTAFKQFGADIATKEVGSGPFKIESFTPGQSITLASNTAYWGGAPYLDRIVLQTIAEPSSRTAALLGGEVDFSFYVDPSQISQLKAKPDVVQLINNPIIGEEWIEINELKPPLDNPAVRQALNYAVDMDAIKSTVYNGLYSPFQGPLSPKIFVPDASVVGFSRNVDKAKQLLAGATPSLTVQYENTPVYQQYAEVLQAQEAQAGISLKLVPLEKAKLSTAYNTGDYFLQFAASSNSAGDAFTFLAAQLLSTAPNNKSGHKGYDDLIKQIGQELDDTKRTALLNSLTKLYFDQAPYMGTANPIRVYGMRSNIQGFVANIYEDLRGLAQTYITK